MSATREQSLDGVTRFLHLGLVVFGVWAWWIGDNAGDYKLANHLWYTQHLWVGITFTVFLLARIAWGIVGPASARFGTWVPWNAARFSLVIEDLRTLARLRVPERPAHQGLSGLVQALGLAAFLWLGLSGLALSVLIEPGSKLVGWPHALKELHEIGEVLVPAYLVLHVGAVLLHSLTGRQVWRKMVFLE